MRARAIQTARRTLTRLLADALKPNPSDATGSSSARFTCAIHRGNARFSPLGRGQEGGDGFRVITDELRLGGGDSIVRDESLGSHVRGSLADRVLRAVFPSFPSFFSERANGHAEPASRTRRLSIIIGREEIKRSPREDPAERCPCSRRYVRSRSAD